VLAIIHKARAPPMTLLRAMLVLISCATTTGYSLLSPSLHRVKPVAVSKPPVRTSRQRRAATVAPQMSLDLGASYLAALSEHYYLTTAAQAFTLVSMGDLIAQFIERQDDDSTAEAPPLDLQRTLRMGMLGTAIGGFGTATWLRWLEGALPVVEAQSAVTFADMPPWLYEPVLRALETFGPEHGIGLDSITDDLLVLIKATLDACVWAPIANTAYLILTPLTEGASLEEVGAQLGENFLPVMKTELSTFFPYNLVAFSLIPPLVRPFSTGLLSMCFSIYISLTTHNNPPLVVATAGGPQIDVALAMTEAVELGAGSCGVDDTACLRVEEGLLGLRRGEASNILALRSGEAASDEASLDEASLDDGCLDDGCGLERSSFADLPSMPLSSDKFRILD